MVNKIRDDFYELAARSQNVKFTHERKRQERDPTTELEKAAQEFEAVFINYLLKTMRKSIPASNLFGQGFSGEFYRGLFDENIAKAVASKDGFGLADKIIKSLQKDSDQVGKSGYKTLNDYTLFPVKNTWHANDNTNIDWDRRIIHNAAKQHDLDAKLVEAVIMVESNYRTNVVSPKGAVGLMQLMASTASEMGVKDRTDPRDNVFGGAKYLRQLIDRFAGDLRLALGAYNAGPEAVDKYRGLPPYPETQRYVEKVLETYDNL